MNLRIDPRDHPPVKIDISLTKDEIEFVWHRLNLIDSSFQQASNSPSNMSNYLKCCKRIRKAEGIDDAAGNSMITASVSSKMFNKIHYIREKEKKNES